MKYIHATEVAVCALNIFFKSQGIEPIAYRFNPYNAHHVLGDDRTVIFFDDDGKQVAMASMAEQDDGNFIATLYIEELYFLIRPEHVSEFDMDDNQVELRTQIVVPRDDLKLVRAFRKHQIHAPIRYPKPRRKRMFR